MNRFEYVKYDDAATKAQVHIKSHFDSLERAIDMLLEEGRGKALAMTKLEEAYMWVGKALKDETETPGKSQ